MADPVWDDDAWKTAVFNPDPSNTIGFQEAEKGANARKAASKQQRIARGEALNRAGGATLGRGGRLPSLQRGQRFPLAPPPPPPMMYPPYMMAGYPQQMGYNTTGYSQQMAYHESMSSSSWSHNPYALANPNAAAAATANYIQQQQQDAEEAKRKAREAEEKRQEAERENRRLADQLAQAERQRVETERRARLSAQSREYDASRRDGGPSGWGGKGRGGFCGDPGGGGERY